MKITEFGRSITALGQELGAEVTADDARRLAVSVWPAFGDSRAAAHPGPVGVPADLTGSADAGAGSSPFDAGQVDDAFLDWYATRHDDVPEAVAEAEATILTEWGPHENLDERSFCACSPHRIEMAARLIREGYFADYANPALRLLPEWTEWCSEQGGLNGDAAARSAKRPAPQLQCSLTTSRPPRMTRRRSAAMSEPHRVADKAATMGLPAVFLAHDLTRSPLAQRRS